MPQHRYKPDQRVITTIRNWTLGTIKTTGTDYVRVRFENYIEWTGFLSPKAIAKTMETLESMGFKGRDLSQLSLQDALDTSVEYIAVIDEEREYEGKFYYSAKWINNAPTIGFSKDTPKDLVDKFSKYDTRAYIADAKDMSPPAVAEDWATPDPGAPTETNFASDDIPF